MRSKQTKGTFLKSDDKDDKDLAHTGPSKGCPSLGRASLTSLGRLENAKRKLFINFIMVIDTIATAFNKSKLVFYQYYFDAYW